MDAVRWFLGGEIVEAYGVLHPAVGRLITLPPPWGAADHGAIAKISAAWAYIPAIST